MKAFRAARLDNELRTIAFSVLRKLCGRIGYLPDSYLLSDKFDLSGMPRASGGFSDVRMGAFRGKDVAVKSLRISEMDDKLRIRRVRNPPATLCSGSLTYCVAFLQGGCHVEEPIPPECPRPYWGP